MSLFDGRRALWLHMYSQLGEKNIEEIAATAMTYAQADIVMIKAMDSQTWMSRYDTSPEAISGLDKWRETVARGAAAGITVLPWVVPFTHDDAAAHAALGDTVVIDLEPYYDGFWKDNAPAVVTYLQGLRDGGVKNLFVSIDPRHSAEVALNVPAWAHMTDGLLPQVYWTDFKTDAMSCVLLITDLQTTLAPGIPIYPALPYNASPGDLTAFWGALNGSCQSASLWRMGTASGAQLKAFGALAMPAPLPAPAPVDPCIELTAKLAAATARIATASTALDTLAAELSDMITTVGPKIRGLRALLSADTNTGG